MKNTGLRIVLALVIALTLVIGSVSTVSAVNEKKSASVSLSNLVAYAPSGDPVDWKAYPSGYFDFTDYYAWTNIAVEYVYWEIQDINDPKHPITVCYLFSPYGGGISSVSAGPGTMFMTSRYYVDYWKDGYTVDPTHKYSVHQTINVDPRKGKVIAEATTTTP